MNFKYYFHRHSNHLIKHDEKFKNDFEEIVTTLSSISDADLIKNFNERKIERPNIKSLSEPINSLLKEKLQALNWGAESGIFKEPPYDTGNRSRWRLDFAKNKISVEVAFNHQEATAHNIMKPVLASELNHVQKDIQTELGVIIVATEEMKRKGNFDSAIGTFEKFIEYFKPYNNLITVPIVLIGLEKPKTFQIDSNSKNIVGT